MYLFQFTGLNAFKLIPQTIFNKYIFHPISKSYSTNIFTHKNILATTYLLRQATVMAIRNCTKKSERGEMVCDEGEKRGS